MVGYEKYNTFYMNDIAFSIRGIYLRGTSDANIYGNDFSYNDYGIKFLASSNNSILENSFFENNVGIDIWESSSIDNQIYHNNFINNSCNAQNIGDNNWDNGYPSGGNYWHDYNGTDENEDGIGDTPYNITGGDNQDHYPYMNPNGWKEENKPPIVEIINPIEGYFHLSGIPLLPTRFNLIADTMSLGGFRLRPIRINVTDDMDASEDLLVKIYLDGEERGNAAWNSEVGYHEWKWTGWALGTYTLNITAEDTGSEIGNAEIEVCNFCFLP